MYKSVYDSWSQADKRQIIDDNKRLSSQIDALQSELYNANLKLEGIDQQRESLNKQIKSLNKQREQLKDNIKNIYKTVKLSDDENIALDAFVNYKQSCETQLEKLNDQFSKHKQNIDEQFRNYKSNIYIRCRNVILLISLLLTCLFGIITLYLYSSNTDYIEDIQYLNEDISTMNSQIEKLNKDNKRLQSDYDEASSTISNYKSELNSFKTKYNECESTLKSSTVNNNLKNRRK